MPENGAFFFAFGSSLTEMPQFIIIIIFIIFLVFEVVKFIPPNSIISNKERGGNTFFSPAPLNNLLFKQNLSPSLLS